MLVDGNSRGPGAWCEVAPPDLPAEALNSWWVLVTAPAPHALSLGGRGTGAAVGDAVL